jgi:quercetin dioxygenase-like cupin family protein
MEVFNLGAKKDVSDNADVKKVAIAAAADLTFDAYYFTSDQVLRYHKHPVGDQIFVITEGKGTFFLDDGTETTKEVGPGDVVVVPKDTWHKLVPIGGELVAAQATKAGAGLEWRDE